MWMGRNYESRSRKSRLAAGRAPHWGKGSPMQLKWAGATESVGDDDATDNWSNNGRRVKRKLPTGKRGNVRIVLPSQEREYGTDYWTEGTRPIIARRTPRLLGSSGSYEGFYREVGNSNDLEKAWDGSDRRLWADRVYIFVWESLELKETDG